MATAMVTAKRVLFVFGLPWIIASCGGPTEPPACVAGLAIDCQPLYDPTVYSTIFEKILRPSCAQGRGTCHTADAAQGGLVFDDADDAYARLVAKPGAGYANVVPKDAACSPLVVRLESSDPNYRMPRGPDPLLPSERCTIVKWIAAGAAR
ncbi:MAG TPA: c-type cytochrome domain-containing protein [Polyangiaceae bacterium]|nr:c-type cytochrome domain-containing protein [Polyangiaceae bacterium]